MAANARIEHLAARSAAVVGLDADADTPPFPVLELPRGILELLLSRLLIVDQALCMCTCSALKSATEAALARRTAWSAVEATDGMIPQRLDKILGFLTRHCRRLRHLSVAPRGGCFGPGPGPAMSRLAALSGRHVRSITLLDVNVRNRDLHIIALYCSGLQRLAVGGTASLPGTGVTAASPTDAGLAAVIFGCRDLQCFSLFRCPLVTDASLLNLAAAPQRLRALALHACGGVRAAELAAFVRGGAAARLQTLEVAAAEEGAAGGGAAVFTDVCAAVAAHCPALQALTLCEERLHRPALGAAALSALARALGPRLLHLDLNSIEAGDAFLGVLAGSCPNLLTLSLCDAAAGGAGVAAVAARCPGLRQLRVAGRALHAWHLPAEQAPPGLTVSDLLGILRHCRHFTALEFTGVSPDPEPLEPPRPAQPRRLEEALDPPPVDPERRGHGGLHSGGAGSPGASASHSRAAAAPGATEPAHAPAPPLLAPALCGGLSRLALDWLRADPGAVQGRLAAALAHCGALRHLSLAGYQGDVTELVAALSSAGPPLESACLAHARASDAALGLLTSSFASSLVTLRLAYCRAVTDEGLAELRKLRRLEMLDLYQVPSVSADAVAALVTAAPALSTLYLGHHTAFSSRPAGADMHLAHVYAAAEARRRGGGARVRVLMRDLSNDETHQARAAARAAAVC